jgi:hypothetical protein
VDPAVVALLVANFPENPYCSRYVTPTGRLALEPVFLTPSEWGEVYIADEEIVPNATYSIHTDCGTPGVPDLSTGVFATTPLWGDVVGDCATTPCTPPDGYVNFNDISAIVSAFEGSPGAPPNPWVDLTPAAPDAVIDFLDISGSVDAFRGLPYPDDCNGNGVLDSCDVAAATSDDCNDNGVPDECDTDCQPNGIPDDCDIALGTSEDCQPNGIPDECDISSGASVDCQLNGVPDECDPWEDMDSDGIHDCYDLCNNNPEDRACICPELCECCFPSGVCIPNYPREACLYQGGTPDCDEYVCRDGCLVGDFDLDGDVDYTDLGQFQLCFTGPGLPHDPGCEPADFEPDGDVDCDDWEEFKRVWTEPADPPSWPPCDP